MRAVLFAALLFVACERPSGDLRREVEAQLSPVARPEPAGTLRVTQGAKSTRIARDEVAVEVEALNTDGFEIVRTSTTARFEELRRVSHALDRIELRYAVRLTGLVSLHVVDDIVEARDARGIARLRTEPAFAVDAKKTIRKLTPALTAEGVTWTADAHDLTPPIAIDPAWIPTKSAPRGVYNGTAVPVGDGRVFCVIPLDGLGILYDDATASWTTGPSMSRGRATKGIALDDGRIVVVGGGGSPPTADVYNPTTNTFKLSSESPTDFFNPPGVALKGNKVLLVNVAGAIVYDATTDTWATTGSPIVKRRPSRMVRMFDDRIMVVGGTDASGNVLSSAEIYDPATGTFSSAGSLTAPRGLFNIHALADNSVIVMGGNEPTDTGTILSTTEIYTPSTKTWAAGPKMLGPREAAASITLTDGRILLAGGVNSEAVLTSTELYDPVKKAFFASGELSAPRSDAAISFLDSAKKRVIAIGGFIGAASDAVDIFSFEANGKSCKASAECSSGSCVDSVCCEKSACAADESCAGAKKPGVCTRKQGSACATAGDCGSGFCVDGVCCDRACEGSCEACDVAATKGSCTTLSPGDAPHGMRTKCPGEGACAARCGGVDASTCTLFPGATTACGEASCKDGVETAASSCDGKGGCAPAMTTKCEAYACAERTCKRACAADTDCASGFSCDTRSGRCVFGAKCDGDHTVIVPGAASIDCTPLKCGGSECLKRCSGTNDCVPGTTCDTATGACVVSTAEGEGDSGGCSHGGRPPAGFAGLLLVLSALGRRRSR